MSQRSKHSAGATSPKPASPPAAKSPWNLPVAVADIPETGRRLDFAADERTRNALARLAGVVDLPRLEAGFDLTRHGRDGLRAVGRVAATVVQNCVVTLDPIESEIDEAIDLVFVPASEAPAPKPNAAVYQAIDSDDPPETLQDGVVDLGAVATEFLLLGIDPYPKKQGVAFDPPAAKDRSGHPFAALAALKTGRSSKNG
jgi:uncharacterized metal-binding protein YceD (DUF177 family)